jgi:phospholipid/cholesterol/gamma-HCH transport system permease protein
MGEVKLTGSSTISISGTPKAKDGARLLHEVSGLLSKGHKEITVDLGELESIRSLGGAWLIKAARTAHASGAKLSFAGARGRVADFIELIHSQFEEPPKPAVEKESPLEIIGNRALATRQEFTDVVNLIADSIYWTFIAPLAGRGLRWKSLMDEISEIGSRAIGIVCLLNFLLGVVVAMLSAAQMRLFGVQILVASLLVIGFARELAVIMTSVVVSARTGAAMAAELATMKVYEEIDALKGMGFNVTKFLIAPKVLAILICMPILSIMGFIAGVAGGFFLGMFSLGFTFDRWWSQTIQAVHIGDLTQGFIKSFFFAMIIVVVGCHNGLRVSGGARGVGLATTRAVVMDIFFIVVADMLFASLFYFLT